MKGNFRVRCGVGEKAEITSKPYLSLLNNSNSTMNNNNNNGFTISGNTFNVRNQSGGDANESKYYLGKG